MSNPNETQTDGQPSVDPVPGSAPVGDPPSSDPAADSAAAGSPPPQADPPPKHPLEIKNEALQAEIAALRDRASTAETRLREVSKAYQEQLGEMDAFRKRMEALAAQRVERKAAEVIEQFFEPVRNLKRSMDAQGADPQTIIAGLGMIREQFDNAMVRLGLEEIPGIGANFDPNMHEALTTAPVADKAQDGKVVFVHATGYRLGGKVLQPAQVVIGKFETTAEA